MKLKILLLCLAVIYGYTHLQAQTWQWTHPEQNGITSFNSSNSAFEGDVAHKVATDAQGSIYVLGNYGDSLYLNGTLRTNGQPSGSYIAKYDSIGNLLWFKLITLGANADPNVANIDASDMVINSSGIFITGRVFSGDYIPIKYKIGNSTFSLDTTGHHLYSNYDADGAISEFFLCKLDFNGILTWNKSSHLANIIDAYELCLATDNQNNIVLGGIRGNPNRVNTFIPLTSFALGGDSIADHTSHSQTGSSKIFITKYTSDGVYQWSNFVNRNADIFPATIVCDSNNNIWVDSNVADSTYFDNTLFRTSHNDNSVSTLSKLNSSGSFLFTHELSTISNAFTVNNVGKVRLLACDNANNIYAMVNLDETIPQSYLNGDIAIEGANSSALYTLKYNNNGDLLWYKLCGNTWGGDDWGAQLNYTNGSLWYAGSLRPNASKAWSYYKFDPISVPDIRDISNGGLRYFVAKSDTSGNFSWVTLFHGHGNTFGLSVAASGSNIYSAGAYPNQIFDLGHLKGFVNPNTALSNLFFGKLKDQYVRVGAISAIQVIPGCTIIVPFTSFGLTFSGTNKFTAELSNANGDFTSPTAIGNVTSTGTGSITATVPNTLPFGSTGYRIRIKSSDTLLTGYLYYAYADTGYIITIACSPAPGGLTNTSITDTSANLNWNVVPCAKGYKVQYRVKGTTGWTTIQVTSNIGTVAVSGLTPNTIYQWRVATKCKSGTTTDYSSFTKNKQFTTLAAFAINGLTSDDVSATSNSIKIYPNPTKNISTVEFSENKTVTYVLEVSDLTGKVLWKKGGLASIGRNIIQIDVRSFAQGMYLVSVLDENGNHTIKLNKE